MIQLLQRVAGILNVLTERVGMPVLRFLRQRGLGPAGLVSLAICVALFGAGTGITRSWDRPRPRQLVETTDNWRYALVCESCGHKARPVEHPSRSLAQQNGMYQCPQCGEFKAACYRRGSQTVPPGGW
jgi:hypothetical protein